MQELTIGDVVARTGVAEGTLRMWERRYGFPKPQRTPSGHRRYDEQQLELVRRVAAARAAGLSLRAAIERAQTAEEDRSFSLFAALRQRRPDVEPRALSKRLMLVMSHAIEDECLARAERQLMFACFQRERFYRHEQQRWIELTQGAALAIVFADFEQPRNDRGEPMEIPVAREHPLSREWALVCDSHGYAVCLIGRESASSNTDAPSSQRVFEAIWSVEPEVVREASRTCAEVASQALPGALEPAAQMLRSEPALPARDQLRLATAITNRALAELQ